MSDFVLEHLAALGLTGRRRWTLLDGGQLWATAMSGRFNREGEPITLELEEFPASPRVTVPWRAIVQISEASS